MSDTDHTASDGETVAASDQANTPAGKKLWRSARATIRAPGRRIAVAATCLTATLVGTFLAVAALPESRPTVKLVSIYCPPADRDADGIDAPHHPGRDRLFGLKAINFPQVTRSSPPTLGLDSAVPTPDPNSKPEPKATPGQKPTASPSSPNTPAASPDPTGQAKKSSSDAKAAASKPAKSPSHVPPSIRSWQEAVRGVAENEQLVLHVSSLAQVEQDEVLLYGRDAVQHVAHPVSLSDILARLKSSPARSILLVLEVHWPVISDRGEEGRKRIARLNDTIRSTLQQHADARRHVILSATGTGPARGLPTQPRTVMSHFLSEALVPGNGDTDRDCRVTLPELLAWASPRIAATSQALGEGEQEIEWIPGEIPFVLPTSETSPPVAPRSYPTWLNDAWQQRDRYFSECRWPWDAELAENWNRQLNAAESRWRRGEPADSIQSDLTVMQQQNIQQINDAVLASSRLRGDSLRLATLRFRASSSFEPLRWAADLVSQYSEIVRDSAPAQQAPFIKKAVEKYRGQFSADQPDVAVFALLEQLDHGSRVDADMLNLISQVLAQWKQPIRFPVIEAIEKLQSSPIVMRNAGSILQLYRMQDDLGTDPTIVHLLGGSLGRVGARAALAQRLVWNPGMTADSTVDLHLDQAVRACVSASDAEQTIRLALRQLQIIDAGFRADRRGGLLWQDAPTYRQLFKRSDELVRALRKVPTAAETAHTTLVSEIIAVRQTSESLCRQWEKRLTEVATNLHAAALLPNHALPSSLTAEQRADLFHPDDNRVAMVADDIALLSKAQSRSDRRSGAEATDAGTTTEKAMDALHETLQAMFVGSEVEFQKWVTHWIGTMRRVSAIPSYQRLAERRSISGTASAIPIAIEQDLQGFDWDHPLAELELHYRVDIDDAEDVVFDFLPPASQNFTIEPSEGKLTPDQSVAVRLRLRETDQGTEAAHRLSGVWLRLRRGEERQLVPLRMPPQPNQPHVSIDFGPPATTSGRDVSLHLWPNDQPQPLQWTIRSNDKTISQVIVTIESLDTPAASLVSAPITLADSDPSPIRFLPPKQAVPDGSRTATSPIQSLTGALRVTVSDVTGERSFGTWQIRPTLRDARQAITLGAARYHVAANGTNMLEVEIAKRAEKTIARQPSSPYAPRIGLNLPAALSGRLIDCESSRWQCTLSPAHPTANLFAQNLRFTEGSEPTADVPLTVNGDEGYITLAGRFPRRSGDVQLSWQLKPSLQIEAPAATFPGASVSARIKARNLQDSDALVVELLHGEKGPSAVQWQRSLATSRELVTSFSSGGVDATLQVLAERRDWQIPLPTELGTGAHRIRVRTSGARGDRSLEVAQLLLIDDSIPRNMVVTAEPGSPQPTLQIRMLPAVSGVESVEVQKTSDASKKPTPGMRAQRQQADSDTRWQLDWPAGEKIPDQVRLQITTGAGKLYETEATVSRQTAATMGKIVGRVMEGALPQPGLKVSLFNHKGQRIDMVATSGDGSFAFSVSSGRYRLSVEKAATQRRASANATVTDQGTVQVPLSLQRSLPGAA